MSTSPAPAPGQPAQFDQDELLVADVYAAGLLEAADAKNETEEVAAELADLIRYMGQEPDFERFLTAAGVEDDDRRAGLEKLFRGRMSDLLLNMLQVLNNHARAGMLRAVGRCVQLRMEARNLKREVTVKTAAPLTDALREQIRRVVGEYIGKEALLIERVEPRLIGGLVLQIGDVQVEASVAAKLHTMLKRLGERAVAEIHRGERYVTEA